MTKAAETQTRVEEHTNEEINEQIRKELEIRVLYYAQNPDEIDDRLEELKCEWDVERMLETNAAAISLFGLAMSTRDRKWAVLPFVVAGFLLQHAIQGWCPPLEVFRRLGVRTTSEIDSERNVLKLLRGDYGEFDPKSEPQERAATAIELVCK